MIFSWLLKLTDPEKQSISLTVPRLVCWHWKQASDQAPHLWTNLYNAPLKMALERSQSLPLKITENSSGHHPAFVPRRQERLDLLRSVATRIKSLTLIGLNTNDIAPLLKQNTALTLPMLRSLELRQVELTRDQWQRLIRPMKALQHLAFEDIWGELDEYFEGMELLGDFEHTAVIASLSYYQAEWGGLMFGLQWSRIRSVSLTVNDLGRFPQDLHSYANVWARSWHERRSSAGATSTMKTTITIRALSDESHEEAQTHITSTAAIQCEEDPSLHFKLTTTSRTRNGVHLASWPFFPTLQTPPNGSTHLVIHPASGNIMQKLEPNVFVRLTQPSTVAIGDSVHPFPLEKRGNWLRRLWGAHLRSKGWFNVEEIQCETDEEGVLKWVKEQCKSAKQDVKHDLAGGQEGSQWGWSGEDDHSYDEISSGSSEDHYPPDSNEEE